MEFDKDLECFDFGEMTSYFTQRELVRAHHLSAPDITHGRVPVDLMSL